MSYKTVLVHVDDGARRQRHIAVAAAIALLDDGHLVGVAPTGLTRLLYQNAMAGGLAPNLSRHLDSLRDRAARALAGFQARAAALGVHTVEARMIDDEAGPGVSLLARYADLVVIGQGAGGDPAPYVVLNSARPVLIVPPGDDAGAPARRVLICWNASREAGRAVSAALPLLRRAGAVHVAVFDAARDAAAHGPRPGVAIADHLARHGVRSTVSVRACPRRGAFRHPDDIGAALLAQAAELSSDLLVMGAYGHSRLRETILGGVTRTVLRDMTMPALMAH